MISSLKRLIIGSPLEAPARTIHGCQLIRYYWWYSYFYFPRLLASIFIRRAPKVRGFPGGHTATPFFHQLRGINVFAPTRMCRVMTRHGSDKGQGWRTATGPTLTHNYTTIYSVLFGNLRDRPLRIFELGLGTNNANFSCNMGANGIPGASLRGWRELFPNALVFGADIDRDILFQEYRIKTFYCDQLDSVTIRDLWSQPVLQNGMDIIIDDGLHSFEANTSFLGGSLEHLRPGGVYVIEDVSQPAIERWHNQLEATYSKRFPNYEFALVTLPNAFNDKDNNLLIIHRHS
jgi:hypothetical protein